MNVKLMETVQSPLLEPELERCVNKKDLEGNTPLHYASQAWWGLCLLQPHLTTSFLHLDILCSSFSSRSQATVRQLLERGSNIGLRNK